MSAREARITIADQSYRNFASDLIPLPSLATDITGYGDVVQVAPVDPALLAVVKGEVGGVVGRAKSNYDKYHDGRWKLLALVNGSGDSQDTTLADSTEGKPTEVLQKMPATTALLEETFAMSSIVSARIARFQPGGNLWEHADLTPMEKQETRPLRHHIPTHTEPGAVFVSNGYRVHMAPGSVWRIDDIGRAHGVTHEGTRDRIHLMVDYRGDLRTAYDQPHLDPSYVQRLPEIGKDIIQTITNRAANLIEDGQEAFAENGVHSLFFRVALGGISTHEIIRDAYASLGLNWSHKVDEWNDKIALYMQGVERA